MRRSVNETIGIMGAGIVGGSLLRRISRSNGRDVRVYDPPKGHDVIRAVDDGATSVFVCVPTPYTAGRGFDDSHLLDAVARWAAGRPSSSSRRCCRARPTLLQSRYPQHRFIFNPEFLREATAFEDFVEPGPPDRRLSRTASRERRPSA